MAFIKKGMLAHVSNRSRFAACSNLESRSRFATCSRYHTISSPEEMERARRFGYSFRVKNKIAV